MNQRLATIGCTRVPITVIAVAREYSDGYFHIGFSENIGYGNDISVIPFPSSIPSVARPNRNGYPGDGDDILFSWRAGQ